MSEIEIQQTPEATVAPSMSQIDRTISIFTAPSKTFTEILSGKLSWWLPFLLYAVMSIGFYLTVDQKVGMRQAVENQIHQSPKTEEQLANLKDEQREQQLKLSVMVTRGVFIASPVMILIGTALIALVLWGTINFGFGGKSTFSQVFTVYIYAGLPGLIKYLLGIAVLFCGVAPESFNLKNFAPTNLAAFLNPAETNAGLYSLLSSLDFVTIWTLALLSIGLAIVAKTKRSTGYIAVFGWWTLIVLGGAAFAFIKGA